MLVTVWKETEAGRTAPAIKAEGKRPPQSVQGEEDIQGKTKHQIICYRSSENPRGKDMKILLTSKC